MGTTLGLSKIADKFNIKRGKWQSVNQNGYDINKTWAYISRKIKITKKGLLTQFPWSLGPIGTELEVSTTHTTSNGANRKCMDGTYKWELLGWS